MIRATVAIAAALVLSGCASTKTTRADVDALSAGSYRTVTVSTREKPAFTALTAGKAQFGLIGAAAMVGAGNKIVRDNAVADPAVEISRQLAAALATRLGSTVVDNGGRVSDASKPAQLAGEYAVGELLVDVKTENWSFGYFPTDWNNYRVFYRAKLQLVDTRSKRLLAEGSCSRVPERTEDAPSHDELLADGAARLKAELDLAIAKCVPELAALVFGIGVAPSADTAAR